MRVVTDEQLGIMKQSAADAKAAATYVQQADVETPTDKGGVKLAAAAMRQHVINMAAALEIRPEDLPQPRVSVTDWKYNPEHANEQTMENLKKDDYSVSTMVSVSVIATMLAGIGLRMGAGALAATPFGGIISTLGTLFGQAPQIKRDVYDKILASLEEYKEIDPDWKTNKLYVLLSDKLTNPEKDFIKKERHAM
jgi:hypothetical protein